MLSSSFLLNIKKTSFNKIKFNILKNSLKRNFSAIIYDFENLVEMQEKSCKQFNERKLFGTKKNKDFEWLTFGDFANEV